MTKKNKLCYRTIDPHNEPTHCIGNRCMAWIDTKTMSGCAFVLGATTEAIKNLYEAKKLQGERDDQRKRCEQCKKTEASDEAAGESVGEQDNRDKTTEETPQSTNDS